MTLEETIDPDRGIFCHGIRLPPEVLDPILAISKGRRGDIDLIKVELNYFAMREVDMDLGPRFSHQSADRATFQAVHLLKAAKEEQQPSIKRELQNWAIKYLKYATQKKPDDPFAHKVLGFCCYINREFSKALIPLQHAAKLNPNCIRTNGLIGLALHHLGQEQEALPHLERAIQLQSVYSSAAFLFSSAQLHEEEARAQQQLEDPHSMRELYVTAGIIHLHQRHYESSSGHLTAALNTHPDDKEAYFYQGLALLLTNKYNESLSSFQKAGSVIGTARANQLLGHTQEAENMYVQIISEVTAIPPEKRTHHDWIRHTLSTEGLESLHPDQKKYEHARRRIVAQARKAGVPDTMIQQYQSWFFSGM